MPIALLALVALLFPSLALGQVVRSQYPRVEYMYALAPAIADAAINAACAADVGNTDTPTCASFELDTRGYKSVTLIVRYVKSSATEVQLAKDDSLTSAPPWGVLQIGDATYTPDVLMADHRAKWNVSGMAGAAGATWSVTFDVTSPYTRFRFTSTGGAAGDVVTVYTILMGY